MFNYVVLAAALCLLLLQSLRANAFGLLSSPTLEIKSQASNLNESLMPHAARPSFRFSRGTISPNINDKNKSNRGGFSAYTSVSEDEELITTMQHISGVKELVESHSTFLLDMWGVMHNGSSPYEGVLNTVAKLKAARKKMIILSNSSKRLSHAHHMLEKLGFDPEDFDQIITSGEVSHRMLSGDNTLKCNQWPILSDIINRGQTERRAFVFGSGDGDQEYCSTSGWALTPISEANLVIARGTFTINDGKTITSKKINGEVEYFAVMKEALQIAADRRIPMLVCNPDKVRPDEGLPPMPGAIGDAYEALLGGGPESKALVKRIGKPYKEVYDLALGYGNCCDPTDACMVGDSLETDVTGGLTLGCTTLWVVKDGIHGPDALRHGPNNDQTGALKVVEEYNSSSESRMGEADGARIIPSFVTPHFRW